MRLCTRFAPLAGASTCPAPPALVSKAYRAVGSPLPCAALTSTPRLLARTSSACPAMSLVSGLPCARIQGALPVAGPGARSAGIHRNVVAHARVPTNVHPCPGVRSWVRPADGRAGHHPVQGEQPNEERTQANKECCCLALPCHLPSCPPINFPSASLPRLGSCADRSLAGLGVPVHGGLLDYTNNLEGRHMLGATT